MIISVLTASKKYQFSDLLVGVWERSGGKGDRSNWGRPCDQNNCRQKSDNCPKVTFIFGLRGEHGTFIYIYIYICSIGSLERVMIMIIILHHLHHDDLLSSGKYIIDDTSVALL